MKWISKSRHYLFHSNLWLIVLALGAFSEFSASAQNNTKPNILFVLIDDMGWKDLSCTGSTYYDTPHIDGLAVV
jgi:hypothetical protein